eukprot:CFRG6935T1
MSANFMVLCALYFYGLVVSHLLPKREPVRNLSLGKMIAQSETPLVTEFKLNPLDTVGQVKYGDDLHGHLSTAHPHYIGKQNINYITQLGRFCKYLVYKVPTEIDQGESTTAIRTVIAEVPAVDNKPCYMHSFGQTENHTILVEFPWIFNLRELVATQIRKVLFNTEGTVLDFFKWMPEEGTTFTVINNKDGTYQRYKGPATFGYHHVNAWEEGKTIKLDIVTYDKPNYSSLALEYLRKKGSVLSDKEFAKAKRRRFTIDTSVPGDLSQSGLQVTTEIIINRPIEFPRINYDSCNGKPYSYYYGMGTPNAKENPTGNDCEALFKVDVNQRTEKIWFVPDCRPSEPVFIANPKGTTEDDGVVVSVILDFNAKHSFLLVLDGNTFTELVLDGNTFTELGRANLPHHNPAGLHGYHYKTK